MLKISTTIAPLYPLKKAGIYTKNFNIQTDESGKTAQKSVRSTQKLARGKQDFPRAATPSTGHSGGGEKIPLDYD
jgi:hypothetical protein